NKNSKDYRYGSIEMCSKSCNLGDDCGIGLECGIAGDGARRCVPSCGSNSFPCVDGHGVSCNALDDTHCGDCGGCVTGQRCEPGVGCSDARDVGAPCAADLDCKTEVCGANGTCRVHIGESCDATNCDVCWTYPDGTSFCTRPCLSKNDCQGHLC